MLLHELEEPIRGWQYAERYLGVGTRTYSPFSADLDISRRYHPQHGARSFGIPTFWVPHEHGRYLDNSLPTALHDLYRGPYRFLLPVHPDTLAHRKLHERVRLLGCRPGPPISVVPSANARTVFVDSIDGTRVPPHFLKLHYPRRLSRFTRRLRRPVIGLQLWVAEELARLGVDFLPEVGGGVFSRHPTEAWGFLLREVGPQTGGRRFTVPLFALYGRDLHSPADPTLLEQLVRVSGEDPEDYIMGRIIRPMIDLWLDVARRSGCALELHGQNVLFSFSSGGDTTIGYRDCAVYVDPGIRARLGLDRALPEVNVISRDIPLPPQQVFSLTYDSFMGHHALSYVAEAARKAWGLPGAVLQEAARQHFQEVAGGGDLLPETEYYYDGALHPDGKWNLIDTGIKPRWR